MVNWVAFQARRLERGVVSLSDNPGRFAKRRAGAKSHILGIQIGGSFRFLVYICVVTLYEPVSQQCSENDKQGKRLSAAACDASVLLSKGGFALLHQIINPLGVAADASNQIFMGGAGAFDPGL